MTTPGRAARLTAVPPTPPPAPTLVSDPQGPGRPPWTWSRARDVSLTLLCGCGLVYVAWLALRLQAGVALLFVLAALLAFIRRPIVDLVGRRTGWSRAWAALSCSLLAASGLAAAGTWAVAQLSAQATALVTGLPAMSQALQARLPVLQARAGAAGITVDVAAARAAATSAHRSASGRTG